MSDVGEGMIIVGQLVQDWRKGDFSRGFKGCGACGCAIVVAIACVFVCLALVLYVIFREILLT